MDIKINDKKFDKDAILKLIAQNKLQTIVHIRSIANIGLKDAKEIVENLAENPNYYDNTVVKKPELEFFKEEEITLDLKNSPNKNSNTNRERKVGSHLIKDQNTNKKWIYLLGVIFILALLYFIYD